MPWKRDRQLQEERDRLQRQVQQLEETQKTAKTEREEENKRREMRWQTELQQSQEERHRMQRQVQLLQMTFEKEKTERKEENKRREEENKRREERWQEERQQIQEEKHRLQRQVQLLQMTFEKEKTERKEEKDRREEENKRREEENKRREEENKRREERWQEERQQIQKERGNLQREIGDNRERDDLKRERDALRKERDDLDKKADHWEMKAGQCQAIISILKEENDRLQRQLQRLEETLKAEKTEWEEENKGREENRKREERWRKELQQSQAERDTLQRLMQQLQTTLQIEKTAREKENKDWEKRWQQVQQQHQVEIRSLREDITAKTAQIADYKHRLSEMASEWMRQGKACVEDLNDPFRPTALADKWTGLFKTGEYWTAYDKAQNTLKTDKATAQFLYNVTKTAWNVCFDFVEDFVPKVLVAGPCSSNLLSTESEKELRLQMLEKLPEVRRKLEELLPQDASRVDKFVKTLEEEYNNVRQTDIPNLQQKLRKAVSLLPKTASPPALLAKKVAAAVHEEENSQNVKVAENFLRKLTGLCYLMRLQEVPLSVNFDFTRGSPLDQSMFEVESNASQPPTDMAIKSILWPPLLRSAGGAVLSKGEADVEPAKPASDSATKVQSSGEALEKQNGDETAEPKWNELDERKKEDKSNQNEEGGDIATGVKDTSTDSSSQDGKSDQDKAKENSANASQTNPDDHEEKSDQDKHEEGSGQDTSEEASNANQNNARGSHDDENNDRDFCLD